jgi:NTP pyrophosphatase (non-canonical NTP hydrolase)
MEKTMTDHLENQASQINNIVQECHGRSVAAGWYSDPKTGEPLQRNVGEMLALIHSEVSEALEGHRKNLKDTHLSHRPMIEVELADVLIRIGDLAGFLKLDLGGAYAEKLRYNAIREDHKLETRKAAGGKSF